MKHAWIFVAAENFRRTRSTRKKSFRKSKTRNLLEQRSVLLTVSLSAEYLSSCVRCHNGVQVIFSPLSPSYPSLFPFSFFFLFSSCHINLAAIIHERRVCPWRISISVHRYLTKPSVGRRWSCTGINIKRCKNARKQEDTIRGFPGSRYRKHVDEWRVQWAFINQVPREHVNGIINIHHARSRVAGTF